MNRSVSLLLFFAACAPVAHVDVELADDPSAVQASASLALTRMPRAPTWYTPNESFTLLAGTAADDIWAASDDGMILHYDGVAWDSSKPGLFGYKLRALAPASKKAAFAIDETSTIFAFNGAAWSPLFTSAPDTEVACAVAANDRRFYVYEASVQHGASVWDYENTSSGWSRRAVGGFYSGPNNVWGSDVFEHCTIQFRATGDLLISGHPAKVWDGAAWAPLWPTDHELHSRIYDAPTGELFALDADGVRRFDGNKWVLDSTPLQLNRYGEWHAIGGRDASSVVLVGDNGQGEGALAVWTGSKWVKGTLPSLTPPLRSVWVAPTGEVVIGADRGQILSGAF